MHTSIQLHDLESWMYVAFPSENSALMQVTPLQYLREICLQKPHIDNIILNNIHMHKKI